MAQKEYKRAKASGFWCSRSIGPAVPLSKSTPAPPLPVFPALVLSFLSFLAIFSSSLSLVFLLFPTHLDFSFLLSWLPFLSSHPQHLFYHPFCSCPFTLFLFTSRAISSTSHPVTLSSPLFCHQLFKNFYPFCFFCFHVILFPNTYTHLIFISYPSCPCSSSSRESACISKSVWNNFSITVWSPRPHLITLLCTPLLLNLTSSSCSLFTNSLSSCVFLLNSTKQASCKRPVWNDDKFAWINWSELQLVHLYSAAQQEIIVCRLRCRQRFLTYSSSPQPRNELTLQWFTYFCETKLFIIRLILHLVPSCWHVAPHRLLLQFCSPSLSSSSPSSSSSRFSSPSSRRRRTRSYQPYDWTHTTEFEFIEGIYGLQGLYGNSVNKRYP